MRGPKPIRQAVGVGLAVLYVLALAVPAAAAPPTVEAESASEVSSSDAILEAVINPGNLEGGAYYQFQIAADPGEFWPEVTCPEQSPEVPEIQCLGPYGTVDGPPPEADIQRRPGDLPTVRLAGGAEGVRVALRLSTTGTVLQPGTTYHYRVLAVETAPTVDTIVWEPPPTYGADQTFTTPLVRGSETGEPATAAVSPDPPATGSAGPTLAPAVPLGCRKRTVRRPAHRHGHGHRSARGVSLCQRRPAR